jgi:iron complex outermembrane receptor protein
MIPYPTCLRRGALALALTCLALPAAVLAADATRDFDVPAGRAAQTLKQFAAQAGREIVYAPDAVGDVQTNAVRGSLVPKDALDQMLANTVLVGTQDQTGAFAVSRRPGPNGTPTAADPAPATPDKLVKLSPFTVSSDSSARYEATESTSGSRVAVSLMDSTQHVAVVTSDLMGDVGIGRAYDAAKYIAGVDEATLPNAQDRTNIRGFQIDGVTLDGFSYFSYGILDPVVMDRIEVVKGPNAILAPTGQPGGTENIVSKKPFFADAASMSGEVGLWSAQRFEFDDNQVISPDKLAFRVVGAYQDTDDYPGNNNFNRSSVIMPMLTYRASPSTQITVQVQSDDWRTLNYLGIPINPNDGTNSSLSFYPGISRSLVPYDADTGRYQKDLHGQMQMTTNFTDALSMRIATNWIASHAFTKQSNLSGQSNVVIDPNTGAFVLSPTPAPLTGIMSRSYTNENEDRRYWDLQNDYVYHLKTDWLDSSTVAGFWLHYDLLYDLNFNATKPNFSVYNYFAMPVTYVPAANGSAVNGELTTISRTRQGYVSENLTLLNDHLVLSGGVADASYQSHVNDAFRKIQARNDPSATMYSYGAVVKPIPELSFYYGYSEQATPIAPSTTAANPLSLQTGKQNEYGVRMQLLDKRVYATVSYYDITQNNFSVPNPANLVVPAPVPPLPPLFMDRKAHGWEFETTAALTSNLSLIANFTTYKNRNPFGQVFRDVAEQSGALWAAYEFKTGALKGLTVGAGLDYEAKRPGDAPSSTPTAASTPAHVIVPQPSFWLPARTLVNASISYEFNRNWKAQLNIDNVLDTTYFEASINRFMVYPGVPFNPRLTVTYKF